MTLKHALLAVALLGIGLFAGTRVAATQDAASGPGGMDMMEAMKLAQPGPEHEELMALAGDWVTDVSLGAMPGMPPMEQKGTTTATPILGGRFLMMTSAGNFMGMPFEGINILGFDRRHGEYTLVGFDTLGTYSVSGRGKKDDDGVIRMHGTDDDPMGKQVFTFEYSDLSADSYAYRIVFEQIGPQVFDPPFAMVEAKAVRK